MNKKPTVEIEEIEFHFPNVMVNGIEGVTIKAKDLADANEKLKKLITLNS